MGREKEKVIKCEKGHGLDLTKDVSFMVGSLANWAIRMQSTVTLQAELKLR